VRLYMVPRHDFPVEVEEVEIILRQGIVLLCGPAVPPHGLDVVLGHTWLVNDIKGAPTVAVAFVGQHSIDVYRCSHSRGNHKRRMRPHRTGRDTSEAR
jgi:hypothetical protein